MIGLAYIVLSDKWEEHKLKRAAAAKAESDYSISEVPDTDIEGVVINYCYRPFSASTGDMLRLLLTRVIGETRLKINFDSVVKVTKTI